MVERVRTVLPHADVMVHTTPKAPETESTIDAAIVVAARLNLGVHHVRAFRTPDGLKLDMHMEVPSFMTLRAAHQEADKLENELRHEIPELRHVEIHIEPRHQEFHELSSAENKKIVGHIQDAARTRVKYGIHDIEVLTGKHGLVVSLHCYLPGDMPIADAHALTANIETAIREQVPDIYRVTVHPEPK